MDYEQRYKEALERAKKMLASKRRVIVEKQALETIFPELAESEDERIRKWCISHFKAAIRVTKDNAEYQEYLNNKVIPWLEKQGEQKPTADDKKLKKIEKQDTPKDYNSIDPHFGKPIETESKFKVGDWIFSLSWGTARIISTGIIGVNDSDFLLEYTDGKKEYVPIEFVNSGFDKWSIQDAKDGDVLARNNDMLSICIFAHFSGINNRYSSFLCHCGLEGEGLGQQLSINGYHDDCKDYVPATKEQRNLLFQKIKEAGYEWDNQRKQLDNLLLYKKN